MMPDSEDVEYAKCPICNGFGILHSLHRDSDEIEDCYNCSGTGKVAVPKHKCNICNGRGYITPKGLFNTERKCESCNGKGYWYW